MVYFNPSLVAQAEKAIMESHDLAETANDLLRIKNAINKICFPNGLQMAHQIDTEMRQKHPMIDEMLRIANCMPRFRATSGVSVSQTSVQTMEEVNSLTQDMFGILCETLIKKGYTQSVEQFIERVDE